MSLGGKKICIGIVLVVAFFLVAVLMVTSVNLFSLSESSVNRPDLLGRINASSIAKVLSPKDELKLIEYFYEYQKLKSNISSLSYDELSRFLFLGKYLAKYIDPKYLGISKEIVDEVLSRCTDIANKEMMSGVVKNSGNRDYLLKQVGKIKDNIENLYDADKISKSAYQEILARLGDIEYHINLSSLGDSDIQVDLNEIAKVISKEKAGYGINADLSIFDDVEGNLSLAKKELKSVKYISDFVNSSMDAIGQSEVPLLENVDKTKMDQFLTVVGNIDSDLLGDVLGIVGQDDGGNIGAEDIDFSKTMKLPNITVEGSIEDAWNINLDASSLKLDNLLVPVDVSILSEKSLNNVVKAITKVKVPGISQGDVDGPDIVPTVSPDGIAMTCTPGPTSAVNDKPSVIPGTTTRPSLVSSIMPEASDNPVVIPSESGMPTDGPVESVQPSEDPGDVSVPWYMNIKVDYKTMIKMVVVVALTAASIVIFRMYGEGYKGCRKKIVYEGSNTFEDMQSNIEKVPINYKERLVALGLDVLWMMKTTCIKDKKERTPREIVNAFLDRNVGCDRDVIKSFLKYYENALFYKLDVDIEVYENFVELCNVIYGILRKEEEGIT